MAKGKTNGRASGKAKNGKAKAAKNNPQPRKRTAEEMSDDQRKVLTFSYRRQIKPLLEAEKNAKAAVSKMYEKAKNEGIPKTEILKSINSLREDGRAKYVADVESTMRHFRWNNQDLPEQLELSLGIDKKSVAERAFARGKTDGQDDLPARTPPEYRSPAAEQHYLSGHTEGRKILNEVRMQGFKKPESAGLQPIGEVVHEVISDLIPPAHESPAAVM